MPRIKCSQHIEGGQSKTPTRPHPPPHRAQPTLQQPLLCREEATPPCGGVSDAFRQQAGKALGTNKRGKWIAHESAQRPDACAEVVRRPRASRRLTRRPPRRGARSRKVSTSRRGFAAHDAKRLRSGYGGARLCVETPPLSLRVPLPAPVGQSIATSTASAKRPDRSGSHPCEPPSSKTSTHTHTHTHRIKRPRAHRLQRVQRRCGRVGSLNNTARDRGERSLGAAEPGAGTTPRGATASSFATQTGAPTQAHSRLPARRHAYKQHAHPYANVHTYTIHVPREQTPDGPPDPSTVSACKERGGKTRNASSAPQKTRQKHENTKTERPTARGEHFHRPKA